MRRRGRVTPVTEPGRCWCGQSEYALLVDDEFAVSGTERRVLASSLRWLCPCPECPFVLAPTLCGEGGSGARWAVRSGRVRSTRAGRSCRVAGRAGRGGRSGK